MQKKIWFWFEIGPEEEFILTNYEIQVYIYYEHSETSFCLWLTAESTEPSEIHTF